MSYMGKVKPTVALSSSDIEDGAVVEAKIGGDAVTSSKISDGAIVNADVNASAAIVQSKLATLAITDSEVADNALSGNKIDGGTISNFTSTGIDDNADANAITIDSSENVGIGQPTSIGAKLHVKSGASGATTEGYHNELTVESSTTGGISILTPNDATGGVVFGDPEDNVVGGVQYDHANNYLHLRSGSAQRFVVGSSGQFGIGATPTYGTSGQVLTSGGASAAPSWADAGGGSPAAECAFRVKKSSTQSSSQNADTYVSWQTEIFDVGDDFDFTNNRFVAPNNGTYWFHFQISTSFVFQNIEDRAFIYSEDSNGSNTETVAWIQDEPIYSDNARGRAQGWHMMLIGMTDLTAGDRVYCKFKSEGDDKTITDGNGTFFEGYQLI